MCVGVLSAVERVKFVSERLSSCIVLRGCWCGIIILNVHAQTEDTNGNTYNVFDEELGLVADKFTYVLH